jgi:uncharacterized protein
MIDYEALAQDAMRGVVRTVLTRAAKTGLPGDHHFYISFDTQSPGVSLSKRLKEKYPEEMTIVLQHRFWDLAVSEERFEVKLTFDGIPERIVVPFNAVKVFFDPSVRYGLQFEAPDFGPDAFAHPATGGDESATPLRAARPAAERKPRAQRKPRSEKTGDLHAVSSSGSGSATPISKQAEPSEVKEPLPTPVPPKPIIAVPPVSEEAPQSGGAQIVSLDKFRKK